MAALTRGQLIEQILRQVYGGYVSEDSSITPMLVNQYINQGIGVAAKANYTDNLKLDGVSYVNGAFYTTFKGIVPVKDETNLWKIQLPQVPVGIGNSEGISILAFKDSKNNVSFPCIPISENQKTYFQMMRPIPNKTIYYSNGDLIYILSTVTLSNYTASVTMISGGDSTDLTSTINVPADYIPTIIQYVQQQLLLQKNAPKDLTNDGQDLAQN